MANHCIEVVCVGCGRMWCERGCNYDWPADTKRAAKAQRRQAVQNRCSYGELCCTGFPTVSDGLVMGEDP